MNKKILFVSLLSVFMLLAIMFASTVTSDTQKPPKKESPLFGIRTRKAIKEKIGDFIRRFIGERVFFLPFQWLRNLGYRINDESNTVIKCMVTAETHITCRPHCPTLDKLETCTPACLTDYGCP
jgi:hypothetical protein